MAVAGGIRSSTALGLRRTAWSACGRTQWQQVRCLGGIDRATQRREKMKDTLKHGLKSEQAASGLSTAQYEIVLPATWVRPPLKRLPLNASYLYNFLLVKGRDYLGRLGLKWSSKPTIFKPAVYKPNTKKIVPMAKAMHTTMYEALAKGDKATLRRTCGVVLAERFAATIDARPAGRRYGWELVRYNKTLFYPRVADHKLMPMQKDPRQPDPAGAPVVRQVVVTIASRQRRVEYEHTRNGGERVIPGSEKEMDVVENLVLNQPLDRSTWLPRADWKIISLIGETTAEKAKQDREALEAVDKMMAQTTRNKIGL